MLGTAITVLISMTDVNASPADDIKAVAALDTQYQNAVKANNAATMDRILAEDFALVTGRGKAYGKGELLKAAREKQVIYEHQEEEAGSQKVRVWSDTAVVTALLWIKAVQEGNPVDYKLWFSDTYIRVGFMRAAIKASRSARSRTFLWDRAVLNSPFAREQ